MKPLVLYAEDDSNDALLCARAFELSNLPIDLRTVDDGVRLISWLLGEGEYADRSKYPLPTLIITDSKMPLRGGLDVLRFVRAHPELRDTPVILYYGSIFFRDLGVLEE
ncbi:MAG: response regulator, partial [Limisphaerales bacterium]